MKRVAILFAILVPVLSHCQIIETVAGTGIAGYAGDGGPATAAEVNRACGPGFDRDGNMYIPDWMNNVIRKVSTSGIITTVVGNGYGAGIVGEGGYTGDGGPATDAELSGPVCVIFDASNNMYITDGNNVIRKVNTSGTITTIAGTGTIGYNGDNIPATAAQFDSPGGIALDSLGNLYIPDEANYRIRKVSTNGIITTIAGNGGPGGYSGDGGPATAAKLRLPTWVAFSPAGELYFTDMGNNVVRKVSSAGIISTVAGNGTLDFSGDGGAATAAGIGECNAIVFDNESNYYVGNESNCTIRKINSSGIITTICGTDSCGYNGDGGPATAAQISQISLCTAVSGAGNVYFGDGNNSRIRRITYHPESVNNVSGAGMNISLTPNPAHDYFTITSSAKIASIIARNTLGQNAFQSTAVHETTFQVNVLGWPPGIYIVAITYENGNEEIRKVIVGN